MIIAWYRRQGLREVSTLCRGTAGDTANRRLTTCMIRRVQSFPHRLPELTTESTESDRFYLFVVRATRPRDRPGAALRFRGRTITMKMNHGEHGVHGDGQTLAIRSLRVLGG